MFYDYSKLRGRIVEKFGTIKEFAQKIGRSTVSVSRKVNGLSSFDQDDVELWSKALDISMEEYGVYFFTRRV